MLQLPNPIVLRSVEINPDLIKSLNIIDETIIHIRNGEWCKGNTECFEFVTGKMHRCVGGWLWHLDDETSPNSSLGDSRVFNRYNSFLCDTQGLSVVGYNDHLDTDAQDQIDRLLEYRDHLLRNL